MKTECFYYVCANGMRIDDCDNYFGSILGARKFYKELTHIPGAIYSIKKKNH